VGTRIWQLIDSSGNLQEIYDTMLNEYEVEADQLFEDMAQLLGDIEKAGLVALKAAS
jgi:hypothetical protein